MPMELYFDPDWTFDKLINAEVVQCVNRTNPGMYLSIPPDPNNMDYQAYLAWVAAGGVPTIVDVTPVPPTPEPVPDAKGMGDVTKRLNDLLKVLREKGVVDE